MTELARVGRQTFETALEDRYRCHAQSSRCRGRAVGCVVFSIQAVGHFPVGVPLGVCERHFQSLSLARSAGATMIRTLERYEG